MPEAQTIVIGAGPAGLACAAALQQAGEPVVVLERADAVGASWRTHYDRLHPHTHRRHSGLPGLPMPRHYPAYPSRDETVAYLEAYAAHHGIVPRFGTQVLRVTKDDAWRVETDQGVLTAPAVVFATGLAGWPWQPTWPGLDTFHGAVLHSRTYRNAAPFAGRRVLVVGLGNSGGEIALDLADAGVDVAVAVRSPVNVVPRHLLGLPIQTWAILQGALPPAVVDVLNAPVLRLATGDLARCGLRRPAKGPMAQIARERKIPLIDIGTIDRIRRGRIAVRPAVVRVEGASVVFEDGARDFDAIILATGYRPDLRSLLPDHRDVLDATGMPTVCGRATQHRGLFFCGFVPVASGQLREIAREARRIAADIHAA